MTTTLMTTRSRPEREIDLAALAASKMNRRAYEGRGIHLVVMSYDLARRAARDRGLHLCRNVDVDERLTNVGAAILKLIDDLREDRGFPRKHETAYAPVRRVTGGV